MGEGQAGWECLTGAQRADIEAHVRGLTGEAETYNAPRRGWTCYHCGETFHTDAGARLHFGEMVTGRPVCCALAEAERVICKTVKVRWARDPSGGGGYIVDEASARKAAAEIERLSSEAPPIGAAGEPEAALSATDTQITQPSHDDEGLIAELRELLFGVTSVEDGKNGCTGFMLPATGPGSYQFIERIADHAANTISRLKGELKALAALGGSVADRCVTAESRSLQLEAEIKELRSGLAQAADDLLQCQDWIAEETKDTSRITKAARYHERIREALSDQQGLSSARSSRDARSDDGGEA